MVMVGGELTLEQLELSFNPTTGFYRAPVQAVANGGVLVIDDFGRQQVAPRDLLNRWIVPLESRVDFLTLQSGQKFELPFMVLVIFATNIKPAESSTKRSSPHSLQGVCREPNRGRVHADFRELSGAGNCVRSHADRALAAELLQAAQDRFADASRATCSIVLSLADYRGEARRMTAELLQAACASYFVDEKESPVVYQ